MFCRVVSFFGGILIVCLSTGLLELNHAQETVPLPPIVEAPAEIPAAEAKVDFARQIQPILQRYCYECHGSAANNGDLRLHTLADLTMSGTVVPGKPDESRLLKKILLPKGDEGRMPKDGRMLTSEHVELIRKWIEQGAEIPEADYSSLNESAIHEVLFIPGEERIVTTTAGGMIRLHSMLTGACERMWRIPSEFEPTRIFGADLHELREPRNRDPLSRFVLGVVGNIPNDAARKNQRHLFFDLSGGRIGEVTWTNPGRQSIQFSSDGEFYLANSAIPGTPFLHVTGKRGGIFLDQALVRHSLSFAALSPDMRTIIGFNSGSQTSEILVFPVTLTKDSHPVIGEVLVSLPTEEKLAEMVWNPSGDVVAAVTESGHTYLYAAGRAPETQSISGLTQIVKIESAVPVQGRTSQPNARRRMSFSSNGKRLLITGTVCQIIDVDALRETCRFELHNSLPLCGQLNSDGTTAVTCDANGDILIWATADGQLTRHIRTSHRPVSRIWWDRNGSGIQWTHEGDEPTAAIRFGSLTAEQPAPAEVRPADIPGGLVVEGKSLQYHWLGANVRTQTLEQLKDPVKLSRFFDRNRLAVVPRGSTTIYLYDLNEFGSSLEPARILHGHAGIITDLAFSPEGQFLATSGSDGAIRIWNCRTVYEGSQTDIVPWLSVYPDDKNIALWLSEWDGNSHDSVPDSLIEYRPVTSASSDHQTLIQLMTNGMAVRQDHVAYTDAVIRRDIQQFDAADAIHQRYFSLAHLYFAGYWQRGPNKFRDDLSFLINSLSWAKKLHQPVAVDPFGSILRIDLRKLRPDSSSGKSWISWTPAQWEKMAAASPYRRPPLEPDNELYKLTSSAHPWIRGDWFLSDAVRPARYIELLDIPRTEKRLTDRMILSGDRVRSGFLHSGIMKHNRLLERRTILGDGDVYPNSSRRCYWKSFDFSGAHDTRNIFEHPSGPATDMRFPARHFEHDAAEIAFTLPNGLIAFAVFDRMGGRWSRPANDVTRPQIDDYPRSCIRCHGGIGFFPRRDEVREHVQRHPEKFPECVREFVMQRHPPDRELEQLITADQAVFNDACNTLGISGILFAPLLYEETKSFTMSVRALNGGKTPFEAKSLERDYSRSFVNMNAATAALEANLPTETFLDRFGRLFASPHAGTSSIRREAFEEVYPALTATENVTAVSSSVNPENSRPELAVAATDSLANLLDQGIESRNDSDHILRRRPQSAMDYAAVAWLHNERQEPDLALKACRSALELDLSLVAAIGEQCYALLLKRELSQAKKAAEKFAAVNRSGTKSWTGSHRRIVDFRQLASQKSLQTLHDNGNMPAFLKQIPDLESLIVMADAFPDDQAFALGIYFHCTATPWEKLTFHHETLLRCLEVIFRNSEDTEASRISERELSATMRSGMEFLLQQELVIGDRDLSARLRRLLDQHIAFEGRLFAECGFDLEHGANILRGLTNKWARCPPIDTSSPEAASADFQGLIRLLQPMAKHSIHVRRRLQNECLLTLSQLEKARLHSAAQIVKDFLKTLVGPNETEIERTGAFRQHPPDTDKNSLSIPAKWKARIDPLGQLTAIRFVREDETPLVLRDSLPATLTESVLEAYAPQWLDAQHITSALLVVKKLVRPEQILPADTLRQAYVVWLIGLRPDSLNSARSDPLDSRLSSVVRAVYTISGDAGFAGIDIHWVPAENGERMKLRFLDESGQPTRCRRGFLELSRKHRTHLTDRGLSALAAAPETDEFFGFSGENGIYGLRRSYDETGRVLSETCLDANCNPVVCKFGYAECRLTYNSQVSQLPNNVSYFDTEGKAVLTGLFVEDNVGSSTLLPGDELVNLNGSPVENTARLFHFLATGDQMLAETYSGVGLAQSIQLRELHAVGATLSVFRNQRQISIKVDSLFKGVSFRDQKLRDNQTEKRKVQ